MRSLFFALFIASCATAAAQVGARASCSAAGGGSLSTTAFEAVMRQVADGWNENNADKAASCFAEDAIYSSVPETKVRQGRAALYQWFGGAKGRPEPMRMQWHHLIFDPEQQIGVGEYTFEYESRTHGLVIVRIRNGLIANWREYEHASPLSWEQMVRSNRF